jgi:RNA polymerase sigma-70 factor (sigma-E family)
VVADVGELFRTRYLALVRLAIQLVDDLESAEDVVQAAFAKYQARRGPAPDDPHAYLRTAVVNGARSALRRRRLERGLRRERPVDLPGSDAAALRGADHAALLVAVDTLPRRQREVVVLRFYEELSIAETAATLGISAGAVTSNTSVAMRTLAAKMGDHRGF